MERVFGLAAIENLLDGQDLQLGIGGAVGGFVESGFGGLFHHRLGRLLEAEEDADLGLFAVEHADEIANLRDRHTARLDGKDNLLGLAGIVVVEVQAAIDAAVGSLLLFGGPRAHLAQRPPLKLVFVFGGQLRGSGVICRLANYVIGLLDLRAKGIGEALLDEADGEVGNVDADPAAIEALRDLDGGAAAAERVEDYVAFVGTGFDDAFEEGFGLLGGIAEALLGLRLITGMSSQMFVTCMPGISSR